MGKHNFIEHIYQRNIDDAAKILWKRFFAVI